MVVDERSEIEIDRLFQALGDATRRDIVARVIVGEQTVSSLAACYAMSFAAVQKHVAVLERAAIVSKSRRGRERIVRAVPESIARARALLQQYEALWRHRVSTIDELLAEERAATPPAGG